MDKQKKNTENPYKQIITTITELANELGDNRVLKIIQGIKDSFGDNSKLLLAIIEDTFNVTLDDIRRNSKKTVELYYSKNILAYLLYFELNYTTKEIGLFMKKHPAQVSKYLAQIKNANQKVKIEQDNVNYLITIRDKYQNLKTKIYGNQINNG